MGLVPFAGGRIHGPLVNFVMWCARPPPVLPHRHHIRLRREDVPLDYGLGNFVVFGHVFDPGSLAFIFEVSVRWELHIPRLLNILHSQRHLIQFLNLSLFPFHLLNLAILAVDVAEILVLLIYNLLIYD